LTNSNENADENSDGTFLLAIANENGDIIKKIKKFGNFISMVALMTCHFASE
jgi:hypothetical protein